MEGGRQEHREEEKKEMTWSQGPEAFVIVGQHSGCLGVESQSNQGTSSERQHFKVAGSLVMEKYESVVLLFKIRVLFNHPLYHKQHLE